MKNRVALASPRTALLLSAAVLLANPAFGQDVPASPPVVPTVETPAPAPVIQAEPAPAPPVLRPTIQTPPPAAETAVESTTPATRPAPVRRTTTTTRATTTQRAEPAPARARPAPAPAPVVAPAPVAQAPVVEVTPAPAPVTEPAPVEATTQTTTTEAQMPPQWPWYLLYAAIVLIGIGAIIWQVRRSRREELEEYETYESYEPEAEPVAVAPEPRPAPLREPAMAPELAFAAPIAAASAPPMMPDTAEPAIGMLHDAEVTKPSEEDLAVVTGAARPEAGRPWLELALRPVRAGSTTDEALVELELTIGNAGDVRADDVRIAAFMLPNGSVTEMERLLLDPPADATLEPMAIEAGGGVEIDATLSVPKSAVGDTEFAPVVVADARYPLPDGSEGRISASFLLGVANGSGELHPIELDRRLREDIEARLHGALERA